MEKTTILSQLSNIYDIDNTIGDVTNKLHCTFISGEEVESFIQELTTRYTILYNKVFVLEVKNSDEYVCTYNVDNLNVKELPQNTILVHRKKESNTLYTINALNELIKNLNEGVVDTRFAINWQHYRNTIMLTQQGDLKLLKTKIFKVHTI
jgi:hypothetical protein